MIVVAQTQAFIFLYCLLFGIAFGVLYEIGHAIRGLFRHGVCITICVDVLVFFSSGILFFIAILVTSKGAFYMYQLVGFWLGFLLERISFGFLFAKLWQVVYTKTASVRKKIKNSKFAKKIIR